MYPRLEINLQKLKHNTKKLVSLCQDAGITSIFGVSKVVVGDIKTIQTIIDNGITHLADSRIENLMLFKDHPIPKVLLRLPMMSDADRVVKYAHMSLNSELEVIKALNEAAKKQGKIHQIILMFDLGDLREGIWFEEDYIEIVKEVLSLDHIELKGIGTNLTCYGGVIPTVETYKKLISIKNNIEQTFNMTLDIISGGNSSSLHLIYKQAFPKDINSLRLGESFYFGRETAYEEDLGELYQDVLTLKAEVIEIREKPSKPIGEIGVDAFGKKPVFVDKGMMKRAILAIGKQDIYFDNLKPIDKKVQILGGSSDHLLLDVTNTDYKLGDILEFRINYGGLLQIMSSTYVEKVHIENN